MKNIIYTLTVLLIISSSVISYIAMDLKTIKEEKITTKIEANNPIVTLKEGNSYNPLLILKKD